MNASVFIENKPLSDKNASANAVRLELFCEENMVSQVLDGWHGPGSGKGKLKKHAIVALA